VIAWAFFEGWANFEGWEESHFTTNAIANAGLRVG